jgi:hypothetical protein
MIIAIVRFRLPDGTTLDKAKGVFETSAPMYRDRPGLIRKHYLFGNGLGGGVYLWESRHAAEKLYTAEWRQMIANRYGNEPDIQFFENPVTVDNASAAKSDRAA